VAVPPFAIETGTDRATVPLVVIVPPLNPVPATIEVTVPVPQPAAALTNSPPVEACTQSPLVRLENEPRVEDAYVT